MISLNIEREMKLEALSNYFEPMLNKSSRLQWAKEILDILDSVDLSTQEAWMAEERLREAELTAIYSREAC